MQRPFHCPVQANVSLESLILLIKLLKLIYNINLIYLKMNMISQVIAAKRWWNDRRKLRFYLNANKTMLN